MDPVVSCPKCQKKYRIPQQAVGKPLKCPACQTTFRTAAAPAKNPAATARSQPVPSATTAQGPPPGEWARYGLDGPLAPSPALFPTVPAGGADPLANHVVYDPGFVQVDIEKIRQGRIEKEKNRLTADPTRKNLSLDDLEPVKKSRKNELLSVEVLFKPKGRINRQKFWVSSILFGIMVNLAAGLLAGFGYIILSFFSPSTLTKMFNGEFSTGMMVLLAILYCVFAGVSLWVGAVLHIKRFHDLGKSGWWYCMILVPLAGAIWVLVQCGFLKGEAGPNQYGPDPLATADRASARGT